MVWDEAVVPTVASSTSATLLPEQTTGSVSHGAGVLQCDQHGAWVIEAHGDYDMQSIKPLADALDAAAKKYPKVILDASQVTFADSTFLNLLILTHQATALRLVAPSAPVRRLCAITAVDTLLEIRDTIEDATAS
ncbi:STAS domain-containing protein [Streptomyces sp. NPDC028635]|uniref:STAS domain-containing protein n=1 Tax=Streptomyces sp. NPDC028635 TaxID=3154800 RepID=UPI0033EA68D4